MSDLSPALLEELAKGFNPDAWDEDKKLPADVRAKLQYWAREAVSDLAPILSRALAEAYREGVEAREYAAAVDAYAANPYLTEKEQSQ